MRVQQKIHYIYSLKSSNGASKSGFMVTESIAYPKTLLFLLFDTVLSFFDFKNSIKVITSDFNESGSDAIFVYRLRSVMADIFVKIIILATISK